jgi:hypothetical protein
MTNAAPHPITYSQAATVPVPEALMRHQLLVHLDLLSKTARLPGRRRHSGTASKPLTVPERLELLALGEHLARHFQDVVLTHIHYAVQEGAAWPQIAAALDRTSLSVRQEYDDWAESQHEAAKRSPGMTTGLSEAEYIKAQAAAASPSCPQCGSDEVAWDGNDDTSESWHCCACGRDWVTGGQA